MRFPKYWVKGSCTGQIPGGKEATIEAFGWSTASSDDALTMARQRAERALAKLQEGGKKKDYEYGAMPFREELIDTVRDNGSEIAVISRNRYGALVLNTASVLFVDIDFPEIKPAGFMEAILLRFSASRRKEKQKACEAAVKGRINVWRRKNEQKTFRLYKTRAGLRLLFTDGLYEPKGSETKRILQELGSDLLYQRLTERQDCFRARLTPKPWRCGCDRPPNAYPWENPNQEGLYRTWEKTYGERITKYGTCQLMNEYGLREPHAVIDRIIDLHDSRTLATGKPLA